jgi:hypothetical protein
VWNRYKEQLQKLFSKKPITITYKSGNVYFLGEERKRAAKREKTVFFNGERHE